MANTVVTLLRLRHRARSGAPAARWIRGAILAAAVVLAYVLGRSLAGDLAQDAPARALRIAETGLAILAAFISLLGAFVSTLGSVLREEREEDEHLLALPLTFRAAAASRLAEITLNAMRAAALAAVIVLAGTFGVWSAGPGASFVGSGLAAWCISTFLAVLLEALALSSIGALAALLLSGLVPAARREIALIVATLALLAGALLVALEFGPRLLSASPAEAAAWLRVPLVPVRATLRLQRAAQAGGVEPFLMAAGFVATALVLFGCAVSSWARLLRRDLESAARSDPERWYSAAGSPGRASAEKSPWLQWLCSRLPVSTRAVIVRDLRLVNRTPAVRWRIGMLAAALLALSLAGFQQFWLVLLLYYAPGEIAREALHRGLEEEGENLFFLQVVTGGLVGYLRMRLAAGFLITFVSALLLLAGATLVSPALNADLPGLLLRPTLLAAVAWLAVVGGVVCIAVFVPDLESAGKPLSVSPAELPATMLLLVSALLCASIDQWSLDYRGTPGIAGISLPAWTLVAGAGILLSGIASTPLLLRAAAERLRRRSIG